MNKYLLRRGISRKLYFVSVIVFLLSACSGGDRFENSCQVGTTGVPGGFSYKGADDTYMLKGAGTNMWGTADEFFMVWKEVSGDFTISSAPIAFAGKGVNPHRKMGLIIRESLEPGARYADIAVHGDGLTSLQFRHETGGITEELKSENSMPDYIMLERRGETISVKTSRGEFPDQPDNTITLKLPDTCYVGLFVCSHEPDIIETAFFKNVKLDLIR